MARDVFISHAYKDERVAGAVCQELESAGVRCWIAPRNIAADEDWTVDQDGGGKEDSVAVHDNARARSAPA